MFVDFYKLREQPFGETPDPRYLYLTPNHREAIASLAYGIEARLGFQVLVADPGMGKTTLLFHLLEWLRGSARTAFLFQTQCNSRELLSHLLCDLGIASAGKELGWMQEQLKKILIREATTGGRLVVFIDEAQNLEEPVLETIRLLSDFESPTSKLIQFVLAGQSPLAAKLAAPGLVQLRQRVSILSRLVPLGPEETKSYVNYRLSLAGSNGRALFTPDALALIAALSRGVPRHINLLCFGALSLGFAMGMPQIDRALVEEAATDLELGSVAVRPADPQTSGVRSGSKDAMASELLEVPLPEEETPGRSQRPESSWEAESVAASANALREGTEMRASAKAYSWRRELVCVSIALVALFGTGEVGIFLLNYGLAQFGIVSSSLISATAEAQGSSAEWVKGSPAGLSAYEFRSEPPDKNPGRAGGASDSFLAPLQRLAAFAPYAFGQDLRLEVTSTNSTAPSNSTIELPTNACIASLPSLVPSGSLSVHAGGQVKQPHLTSKNPLAYPAEAKRNGIEGDVSVKAVINANGKPTGLRMVSGPPPLQRATLNSVRDWQYEPGYLDGRPVPMEVIILVNFRLRHGQGVVSPNLKIHDCH
jgi:TonB family protein